MLLKFEWMELTKDLDLPESLVQVLGVYMLYI